MTRWLTLQASGGQSVLKYASLLPPARSVSPTAPAASPSPPCHQGFIFPSQGHQIHSLKNLQLGHRALSWCLSSAWVEKLYEVEAGFTKVSGSTESWHQSEYELKAPQPHGPGERHFFQSLSLILILLRFYSITFFGSLEIPCVLPEKSAIFD